MANGPRRQPNRDRALRQADFARLKLILLERLFVRTALWRTLRRDARHPVARHLSRQLKHGRRLPLLPISLLCVIPLLALVAYSHHALSEAVGWALPLILMLFSSIYCAIWIARIVALLTRQTRSGALDEVSVIPPGRVFIYLTICKVVLNEDDALYWLSSLRRLAAAGVFLMLIMSLCIAAAQMDRLSPWQFAAVGIELALFAVVIQQEHTQSALIACLLSIAAGGRPSGLFDRASVIVVGFVVLQILSYSLAIAALVALGLPSLSLALALFLLAREVLIILLWRGILRDANEDNLPPRALHWQDGLGRGGEHRG